VERELADPAPRGVVVRKTWLCEILNEGMGKWFDWKSPLLQNDKNTNIYILSAATISQRAGRVA
jgi:hypothetical protein